MDIFHRILSILNYLTYFHGPDATEIHIFSSTPAGTRLLSQAQNMPLDLTASVSTCNGTDSMPGKFQDGGVFLIFLEGSEYLDQLSSCLKPFRVQEDSISTELESSKDSPHLQQRLAVILAFVNTTLNVSSPALQDAFKNQTRRFPKLFSLDNEVYLLDHSANFYEVYQIEHSGPIFEKMTLANDSTDSTRANPTGISFRRRDFKGVVLRVVGVNSSEYTADIDFAWVDGELVFKSGFSVELLWEMEYFYNFSAIAMQSDNWIDFNTSTGELIGMAANIISGEADLALGITGNLPYSAKFFTFLVTTYSISISAFFKRQDSSFMRNLYFECLQPDAWFVAIAVWITIPVTLSIFYKIKCRNQFNFEKRDFTCGTIPCLWILSAIAQLGWYQSPKVEAGTSVRIIFFSGYVFSWFMYVIYSARLITVLRKIPDPIRTPEDLITSPLTIGLKDEVDLKNWFEGNGSGITTDNLVTTRIMQKLDPIPEKEYILEIPSALQIVNEAKYAFISYPDPMYQFLRSENPDHDICKLYREVVIIKSTFRCSMFVSKSSPYKEHFNYILTRLIDHGLLRRQLNYYVASFDVDCDASALDKVVIGDESRQSIGVRDITTPLGFVIFGNLVAVMVLVAERVTINYLKQERNPYLKRSKKCTCILTLEKPAIIRRRPKVVTTHKMQLFYLYGVLVCLPIVLSQSIKDGFYKIINVEDGTVLTATMSKQRPRVVVTAPWVGSDEQMWKIKTKIVDGEPLQIIRNEKIRDNEVTKEPNLDKSLNKNSYVQTLWNIIKIGKGRGQEEGYELNSGVACLKGRGKGKEIQYVECLDSDEVDIEKSYIWRFEYLFDIPSFDPEID